MGRFLRKLDLTFLLLLAVAPTPACVIPVGPEWQDPLGTQNAPPQILDPDPDWGAEVAAQPNSPKEFKFFVTDVDVVDGIFVKWIVNGNAIFSPQTMIPSTGAPLHALVARSIGCGDIAETDKAKSKHTVRGVIADRAFVTPSDDPLDVIAPGHFALVPWTLNLTCQSSP